MEGATYEFGADDIAKGSGYISSQCCGSTEIELGTVYDFVSLCCKACKVEMAQSQAEYEAMPNGTELLSIYTENDIKTYRDVLYYVGQVLGGFFCINREGNVSRKDRRGYPGSTQ